MVAVAQWAECLAVNQAGTRSIRVSHPTIFQQGLWPSGEAADF